MLSQFRGYLAQTGREALLSALADRRRVQSAVSLPEGRGTLADLAAYTAFHLTLRVVEDLERLGAGRRIDRIEKKRDAGGEG